MGSVRLVRRAGGGDPAPLALKVMKKSVVLRKRQVVHTRQEKELHGQLDHPLIVKLLGTFQDEANLFMLMEFVDGGELFAVLRSVKMFQNAAAKFYATEIILALGHIHSKSIAHRDLKLENVLLDSCGHVKLVDLGFAKVIRTRTYTMCGTLDYQAPEIINRKGHDQCVDWWALGVLIYEMLSGRPPFRGGNALAVYKKALSTEPEFPPCFTSNARSVIGGLLTKAKSRRLGAGVGGVEDVKDHPWFAPVHWDRVLQKQYMPPFLPTSTSSSDASVFQDCPEDAIDSSPVGLSKAEQRQFEGF
ncbi:unnamed protein product [Prorocentrum cordatum]|nr:unnamed protein product [Polarella glacialis]